MSRHITDRRTPTTGDKTRAFLDLARKDTPHPATKVLARKPREQGTGNRVVQFLRIERGHNA